MFLFENDIKKLETDGEIAKKKELSQDKKRKLIKHFSTRNPTKLIFGMKQKQISKGDEEVDQKNDLWLTIVTSLVFVFKY